ncbi:STAG2 protein, partial [Neodrepanis coruscans]|nr:STAG2 protein [Neodrepanis coruscans]
TCLLHFRENTVHGETVPESTVQNGNCVRNGNLKIQREKRKVREHCENIRRNPTSRRRVSQLQNGEVVEAVTLFEVVSMGKQAMQSVVDDWVEAYKQDRNVALLDLINFFIQCSGCQGMVTAEMFQSLHKKDVMRKMTETFDEETGLQYKKFMAYPWILTVTWPVGMVGLGASSGLLQISYWGERTLLKCLFLTTDVKGMRHQYFEQFCAYQVAVVLKNVPHPFQQVYAYMYAYITMKLLTAVVSVHLNLDINKHNAQRLYEVEKQRISGKRTTYRLDQLERKRKEV